jgi:hypothetical protein
MKKYSRDPLIPWRESIRAEFEKHLSLGLKTIAKFTLFSEVVPCFFDKRRPFVSKRKRPSTIQDAFFHKLNLELEVLMRGWTFAYRPPDLSRLDQPRSIGEPRYRDLKLVLVFQYLGNPAFKLIEVESSLIPTDSAHRCVDFV